MGFSHCREHKGASGMTLHRNSLGDCPECGTGIPQSRLLIEYETADGTPAMYAECPSCFAVVHPQGTDPTANDS